MPDWYRLLKAGETMGVPPWELLGRDAAWTAWGLAARHAEIKAQQAMRVKADAAQRKQAARRPFRRG